MNAQIRISAGLLLAAVAVASAPAAHAIDAPAAAAQPALELRALTGPQGGTLTLELAPTVRVLEHVHVRLLAPGATEADALNRKNVTVRDGIATINLGPVVRGTRLDVQVQVESATPGRTLVVRGKTTARLRPDLVVAAVRAPAQTLSTRPIDVVADVSELNGDTAATARLTLMLGPTPVAAPEVLVVPADETVTATFAAVQLSTPMAAELTVRVEGAAPYETDETNNTRTRTVQVTGHELVRANVLVSSLGGYGAQLNQHVYAPVTSAPADSFADLEAKVKALEPQLVRIFYNDNWEERRADAPQNFASFVATVRLAQASGATINITYQTATVARLQPAASMARFAGVLEELVEVEALENVRWVTIQNEPNTAGAALTLEQYEALYRALDAELAARGLGDHVRLMGGDLIEGAGERHHTVWFEYMAEHMSDVLDAYSVHIYWNYWEIPRMEFRLRDVRRIVTAMEGEARKPTYITEMGVRGILNLPDKPAFQPGYWADGTPLARTNISAFQMLWFDLAAAQLGYSGSVKWDAYWGLYDLSYRASHYLIGPAEEGWPLFPSYHALRLLLQTTNRGWEVVRVDPWAEDDWQVGIADQPEQELVAYASTDGHLTLMGLDTNARGLNGLSGAMSAYSIGGLPPNAELTLALWNAAGDGANSVAGTVRTDAVGVARFEVPLHAAFSLTTVPVT
ncbi:MAG TPA: hypothetical protein VFO81_03315 [Gaiellaceae bacterium]|nr:hypothetical protein [Gaiellaceae bacterium]